VTHISTGVSLIACLTMALAGFITFGSKTQGNVLNNFPALNTMVNIARFCFGLNMLTTLPLEAFVCREVMFNYYPGEGRRANNNLHIGVSTGLVACSMFISLLVCDLGAVFEIIGATSACMLAYILPPLCYMKLSTRSSKWIPAVGCVVFGSVVMVMSVVQALIKIVKSEFSFGG
jgi:solute carrier family 38 (sodium-coupled neutral amino acid transporter), member 11